MIKVRIIDKEGKDEVHTVIRYTLVQGKLWMYAQHLQYYIPLEEVDFMQTWED